MSIRKRPLAGDFMGLSISGSKTSSSLGFPESEINRTVLRVVASVLGQGAGVVLGHDWRHDGVMGAVHSYVERFRPVAEELIEKPLLMNFVHWGRKPQLAESERERLKFTLKIEECGLPKSLKRHTRTKISNDFHNYLIARGLTHLRYKIIEVSNARLCIGGAERQYMGRYAGIVEEAYLAIKKSQPLYLSGVLGGATSHVILALKKKNMPEDFCPDKEKIKLYNTYSKQEKNPTDYDDLVCSPKKAWQFFSDFGIKKLSEVNGLSVDENRQLFDTTVVEEAIEMTLVGMGRLKRKK